MGGEKRATLYNRDCLLRDGESADLRGEADAERTTERPGSNEVTNCTLDSKTQRAFGAQGPNMVSY
jgi:hypothetical protein